MKQTASLLKYCTQFIFCINFDLDANMPPKRKAFPLELKLSIARVSGGQ